MHCLGLSFCASSIIIEGRSSVHLTDVYVDADPSIDEGAEGFNDMDDEDLTTWMMNLLVTEIIFLT